MRAESLPRVAANTSGLNFLPRLRQNGVPALVKIDVIEERLDRLALEAPLHDPLAQALDEAGIIVPAAFHQEAVPDDALLIRAPAAALFHPFEHLLIASPL